MQIDERELLTRSLAHEADAYGQLIGRYQTAIYYHCFAIVRDEDIAEDVAQEAFIRAYYKLSHYDQSRKFSTWLFKIATNQALNALKSSRKTLPLADEYAVRLVSRESTEAAGQYAELRDAVVRLEPRYRAVVSLYYWQGLNYEDIAVALDVPVGSVKGWMNRAKHQLRKELA